MSDYLEKPVFITGFNKSGTTLLLSLLDNHNELVVIPEELHYLNNVLFSNDRLTSLKKSTGFRIFLTSNHLKDWSQGKSWLKGGYPEFDMKKFASILDERITPDDTAKSVLLKAISGFADADKIDTTTVKRWACKTTQEEIYVPLLDLMFSGKNNIVYVVRDPRDVYASIKKRENIITSNRGVQRSLEKFIVAWGKQVKQAVRYSKNENFVLIKFEDIINDVQDVIMPLSEYLDLSDSEELYIPTRHGKLWGGNSVHNEEFKGLSKEPIGRYKDSLSDSELDVLQQALKGQMKELGYMPDEVENSSNPPASMALARLRYEIKYFLKQYYSLYRYKLSK